jgi:hypothetical protein
MTAPDPETMLKELRDDGLKLITEDMIKVISEFISNEIKFSNDLMLVNIGSNPNDIGLPAINRNIKKAQQIKQLFEVKPESIEPDTPEVEPEKKIKSKKQYKTFKEIFVPKDYDPYIKVLMEVEPPLINNKMEFIGKATGHKGVIGVYMSDLKSKSIINQQVTRKDLMEVLNNEIKNLGIKERSVSNESNQYVFVYKDQFEKYLQIKL